MERGFDGLYNHVTPNVSDEALVRRLESIGEFVEDTRPPESQLKELRREVEHIAWELGVRAVLRKQMEEEIAWMEKSYDEEDNG